MMYPSQTVKGFNCLWSITPMIALSKRVVLLNFISASQQRCP